ncbi:ArsR/SmtB family transcription factor [Dongia sp.]|uniref:ArsR/SmtB family transcription factor n=1 Tax=Dongia sp. TaxID=1977262 RepID=UPI0035B0235F
MKSAQAISALSALAQETRLDVFRHLMQHHPKGIPAGDLAAKFGVPASTMSAHLAILTRAGLTSPARDGRTIYYAAEIDGIRELLSFLVKDCCNGKPNACNRLLDAALSSCCP